MNKQRLQMVSNLLYWVCEIVYLLYWRPYRAIFVSCQIKYTMLLWQYSVIGILVTDFKMNWHPKARTGVKPIFFFYWYVSESIPCIIMNIQFSVDFQSVYNLNGPLNNPHFKFGWMVRSCLPNGCMDCFTGTAKPDRNS